VNSPPGPFVINLCDPNKVEVVRKDGGTCSDASALGSLPVGAAQEVARLLGEPVDVTTGGVSLTPIDFDLGHGLRFARHYSTETYSAVGTDVMGYRWQHSLEWSLQRATSQGNPNPTPLVWVQAPFHQPAFFIGPETGTKYSASQRGDGSLTVDANGTAHYTAEDGTVATFSSSNQLLSLQPLGEPLITVSASGSSTTFSNGQQSITITTSSGQVSTVTGGGQTWSYTYDGRPRLDLHL
jgi:hypothetical protein